MNSSPKSKNKLSVYLIKQELIEFADIVREKCEKMNISGLGTFYYIESRPRTPPWLRKFFGGHLEESLFKNASSKGVLLTSVKVNGESRIFAVPFGYGWNLLEPGSWESRFGLKVVVNIAEQDGVRRIDKMNVSAIPKDSSEQLSKFGVVNDFGFDIEQDLLRGITAKTAASYSEDFGDIVTGKDPLTVSVKVDHSSVKSFLKVCYEQYQSQRYKSTFEWIDQIKSIQDPKLIEKLDEKMIADIIGENHEKVWMAVPEIIEWEKLSGFSYRSSVPRASDIRLDEFLQSLTKKAKEDISLNTFKGKKISCLDVDDNPLKGPWKAYECLHCELLHDEKTYILSNGKWFEIDQGFAQTVRKNYEELRDAQPARTLPPCKNQYEGEYNEGVAEKEKDIHCMDRELIPHGGRYNKIEFCDLYTKKKEIIHVKHYGQSAVLGHLFWQGVVSGEVFRDSTEFRKKVNHKLPADYQLQDPAEPPKFSEYTIIFAIISASDRKLEIPFFSKVALKNAKRTLANLGFKVRLQKIAGSTPERDTAED